MVTIKFKKDLFISKQANSSFSSISKSNQLNRKTGQRSKQTFVFRWHPDGKKHMKDAQCHCYRNADQNCKAVSPLTPQNDHPPKDLQRFNAAKGEGDRETSNSGGGDGNVWVQPRKKPV